MTFDEFNIVFEKGLEEVKKDIGKEAFNKIGENPIFINGTSDRLKKAILDGELSRVDISKNVEYLREKREEYLEYHNGK